MRQARLLLAGAWLASAPALAAERGATGLRMAGIVQHPQSFTLAQLEAFPTVHVDVSFNTMHGQNHHGWTGALLWDLLSRAVPADETGPRTSVRHVLIARGQDGYAAAFAIGEIDPALEGKQVIVAYRQDGAGGDLAGLRLIVPGDRTGARDVHDVVAIEIR